MSITFGAGISIGKVLAGVPLPSPTVTTATALSTSSSSVTFVPTNNPCFPPVQSHTIIASPGCIKTVVSANTTTAVVTGLSQGQQYTFTVVANNVFEASAPSNVSNTVTQVTVPGAPTIGTAAAVTNSTTVNVAFTAPASNGGATITRYTATSSPGSLSNTGTTSPILVTGLTAGTAYTFTVSATNSVGTSASSSASNSATPTTVPGTPTSISATKSGATGASVSFTAPANNGSAITSYTVTSTPGSITGTGSSSPIAVSGLTAATSYTFTVKAINAVGTGPTSAASNSILTPPAPSSVSYTSPGTYSWLVPAGVTSVSAVVIGAGLPGVRVGMSNSMYQASGAGGGLAYKNNISVTPGTYINISVGASAYNYNTFCNIITSCSVKINCMNSKPSYICFPGGTLKATGGRIFGFGNSAYPSPGGPCGSYYDGGGTGGSGTRGYNYCLNAIGGGGAAGYSGNGGNGGYAYSNGGGGSASGSAGAGGGGGGGGSTLSLYGSVGSLYALGGGGVGLFGQGSNGTAGIGTCFPSGGGGGSGGTAGYCRYGGAYGGGGAACYHANSYGGTQVGGSGAVRIMWPGCVRQFPSTCVGTP